jgi:hypothetical protein
MRPRARTLALRRQQDPLPWLGWAALAALTLAISSIAAHGQAVVAPSRGDSGPQTALPAPLPPGSGADTPGGSARKGVIVPPPVSPDSGINRGVPSTGKFPMPVIRPPGTAGGDQKVVPK